MLTPHRRNYIGLLTPKDGLYFGFTALSYWQVYNDDISAPFRETHYEPEIFWATPVSWWPFDVDASLVTAGPENSCSGSVSVAADSSWSP